MLSLRNSNYVEPPVNVRSLAQLAGITGSISIHELITLLGDRRFGPKPFYVIGHNTNTIAEVYASLDSGANAVEVDVTAYDYDLNQLCIDHAGLTGDAPGGADAPHLTAFLRDLRLVADAREQLALVIFDCKPPAATPEHGRTIISAIRSLLTKGTNLNIIISVGDVTSSNPYRLNGTSIFDQISLTLGAHEGFMIDAQDSPTQVASFFKNLSVTRICYGNGTSFPFSDEGAMVYRTPIEEACWMGITQNGPRFVYAWTVNDIGDQRLYLRIGVDGMISDPGGIPHFANILLEPEFAARYRLAKRSDNPFLPANAAYGLTIQTSDISKAGTDANLTFTVAGVNGSSSITTDSNYNRRMERGLLNFLVLPSPDLGELHSVSVHRDNSGNAPDWHLTSITVESLRYKTKKTAFFDCWIDTTGQYTRELN